MGQDLDGCERAVDSGGLLQCSVGGNTHQCPQQPKKQPYGTGISRPRPRGPRRSGPTAPVG